MIFDGYNGGRVELLDRVLVIHRYGMLSTLNQGLKGEKRIPYASIRSVQFKAAGITTGYIQFGISGGIEGRGGALDAVVDENTVLLTKKAQTAFEQLRDLVEQRAHDARYGANSRPSPASSPSASIGEELTRLADLRDRGVLTAEEFSAEKARLMERAPAPTETASYSTGPAPPNVGGSVATASSSKQRLGKIMGFGLLGIVILMILVGQLGEKIERDFESNGAGSEAATSN